MMLEVRMVATLKEGGGGMRGGSWVLVMSYFPSQVLVPGICSTWEYLLSCTPRVYRLSSIKIVYFKNK